MGVVLPAFNRMVTGSAVDRLASNLKLRLERAQSQAASSRRHVALILPHGRVSGSEVWSDGVIPSKHGGSRMCYVDWDVDNQKAIFRKWVPGETWITPERGSFLVRSCLSDGETFDGDSDFAKLDDGKPQKIYVGSELEESKNDSNSGDSTILCRPDATGNQPLQIVDGLQNDPDGSGGETKAAVSDPGNCAIVFSPKGGICSKSTKNVYFLVAEAYPNGDKWLFPSGKIFNYRVLEVNRLTGKVRHFSR